MQKLKLAALTYFCCCGREDDTPQPTVAVKSNRSGTNNEEENNQKSIKLEAYLLIFCFLREILIKVAEFKPETPKIHKYPYYCPICFRYFNSKSFGL